MGERVENIGLGGAEGDSDVRNVDGVRLGLE